MLLLAAFLLFFAPFCTSQKVPGPSPPQHVSATTLSATDVRVKWEPPLRSHGNITGYVVAYQTSDKLRLFIVRGPALQCDIGYLKPDTEYEVRVRAAFVHGEGPPSKPVFVRTLKGKVPVVTPPQNVTVTVTTTPSILVQWKPPLQSQGNISYYFVTFSESINTHMYGVDNCSIEVNFKELNVHKEYQVTVAAMTAASRGDPSTPYIVYTQLVPTVPRNVSATALSSSAVRVQWEPPAQVVGNLTSYNVTLRPLPLTSPNHTTVVIVNRSTLQTDVPHLLDNTDYQVTVSATSSEGQGTPSAAIKAHTPQKVPTVPRNVSATDLSSSAVRVQWELPTQVVGNLTNYNVTQQILPPTSLNHIAVFIDNKSTLQTDVPHLLDNTDYQVTVSSTSSVGQGTPSAAIKAHTPQKVSSLTRK